LVLLRSTVTKKVVGVFCAFSCAAPIVPPLTLHPTCVLERGDGDCIPILATLHSILQFAVFVCSPGILP
jgi:hypothetical protein